LVDNTIMHFEILGEDLDKLRSFYAGLFGWRFERAPIPDEYWLIQTAPARDGSIPDGPNINGGLTKAQSSTRGIINYVSVESLDESCARIKELGGRILTPKREVFDMGWSVLAEDPEGNRFAIWENMK
jgi:predicted enzyme related to lactoylglutathione lyase